MSLIKYSDEEKALAEKLYKQYYSAKLIVQTLNDTFHKGEPVRTTYGVKNLLFRNGVTPNQKRNARYNNNRFACGCCGEVKDLGEFYSTKKMAVKVCSACMIDNYSKKYTDMKVICSNCYRHIGNIDIKDKEFKILMPTITYTKKSDEKLGKVTCSCGKEIDLVTYYYKWFKSR